MRNSRPSLTTRPSILNPLTFHLIPHTHWDREWYLPRAAFQARWVPVMDQVLEQLEHDPAARFVLDGQTILLHDYLAVKPDAEPRIRTQVERGALEIGPWFVLSDLLIPSADSLARNLTEGARDARRFGRRLDVLYSPDAFGHPGWLPELAARFGLGRAVVRRGLGRPGGRDRDLYRWRSGSGAGLLVHHLPAAGYDAAIGLAQARRDLAREWGPLRRELVERAVTPEIAVFLGADHHAMVRDVAGLRDRLQALEPAHAVRVSGLTEYFDAVERAGADPPVIEGELRRADVHTWVLQDVHSARSRLKRKHAETELLLSRLAEPLATRAAGAGGADREALLTVAWRLLLECQFHDTLAGTTSDLVQAEQEVRLESVEAIARELAARSFAELAGYDPDQAREQSEAAPASLVLWNPSGRSRDGIMTAEVVRFRRDVLVGPPSGRKPRRAAGHHPLALQAPDGTVLPVQALAVRHAQDRRDYERHYPDQDEVDRVSVAFRCPELPGGGVRALRALPLPRPDTAAELIASAGGRRVSVKPGALENEFVSLAIGRDGVIALVDKRSGERYGGLGALLDEPDRGDLYTMSKGKPLPRSAPIPVSQSVLTRGPLVAALDTRWAESAAGSGNIALRQVVTLHADSALVRIRLDVENNAEDHRLRVRFPVDAGEAAVAGAAIGVERRGAEPADARAGPIERPVATAPAHRFVYAGAGERGLGVLSTGFFEYEWTRGRELLFTLFRSIGELAREGLPERPGRAGWPEPTPRAQEPGLHTIHLALKPGPMDNLEADWETVFLPTQALWIREA